MSKLLIILLSCALFSCKNKTEELIPPVTFCVSDEVVQVLSNVVGQIEKVGDFYVINSAGRRFTACNLPENWKANGKAVVFDAQEFKIPANVRLVGTPIAITKIY